MRSRTGAVVLSACLALLFAGDAGAQALPEGWIQVDYSGLVDRRALSHSGESVGVLLERLEGRPVPPPGERPGDRMAHSLLEPLIEPYAFVLADALDALHGASERPLVEVGWLCKTRFERAVFSLKVAQRLWAVGVKGQTEESVKVVALAHKSIALEGDHSSAPLA